MKTLALYKTLLREAEKFSSYNVRSYALRKIKSAFKENRDLSDPVKIQQEIEFAKKNLEIIRRQVIVGNLYAAEKLVIERMSR